MATIHHLPDRLISQIAAGEVVERPSSVVKELVENSLDAGAGEVRVELEAGGRQRILVADDGGGMDRDDALLAFDRHATSKIASFDDLESVGTLGFRGEALAAIAAVSRVELTTARESGDGTRVRIEGGRIRSAEPAARARGTTIEVASLFWNVPARRKFLKAPATELRRALEVVEGYALARPEVRFSLLSEGRALLETLPAGADPEGARRRIGQIFGTAFAEQLAALPLRVGTEGERISGFVGRPETARGKRLFVFVNRRLLKDRNLLSAFYRAVREEWRSEDFPALFLFLDVPPEEVDVNVHPQKAEVRFRDSRLVDRVGEVLRAGLSLARGEEPAPLRSPRGGPSMPFAWQGLGGWEPRRQEQGDVWEVREAPGPVYGEEAADPFAPVSSPAPADSRMPMGRLATAALAPLERPMVPLSGRSGEVRPFRLLGQYKGTLILVEGPDGLYLVDQHVAHERILYERLRRELASAKPASQRLLSPVLLDLAPAERLRLAGLADELEPVGFGLAELSGGTLALTAIPAVLSAEEGEKLVLSLAASGVADSSEPGALARELLEALAASLACKAAVKMHHPLRPAEMEALLTELFAAEQPYACPHGRPIVLTMTDADLERRFGRR
ncbi:MAG TPA: DNA mismatch repair endonuclease MutL [Thermoanaerobaculia bacterium]|nr:DNA mismatch repair endonuclease MutL [Thermoanaerobaculia bacterium]